MTRPTSWIFGPRQHAVKVGCSCCCGGLYAWRAETPFVRSGDFLLVSSMAGPAHPRGGGGHGSTSLLYVPCLFSCPATPISPQYGSAGLMAGYFYSRRLWRASAEHSNVTGGRPASLYFQFRDSFGRRGPESCCQGIRRDSLRCMSECGRGMAEGRTQGGSRRRFDVIEEQSAAQAELCDGGSRARRKEQKNAIEGAQRIDEMAGPGPQARHGPGMNT